MIPDCWNEAMPTKPWAERMHISVLGPPWQQVASFATIFYGQNKINILLGNKKSRLNKNLGNTNNGEA